MYLLVCFFPTLIYFHVAKLIFSLTWLLVLQCAYAEYLPQVEDRAGDRRSAVEGGSGRSAQLLRQRHRSRGFTQ